LGVRAPFALVPALADDLAVADDDGADDRVRVRRPASALRELDRPLEEPHAPGRLSLPPGEAGLRERLAPLAANWPERASPLPPISAPESPAPYPFVLWPPASHRQRGPRNVRNLTARGSARFEASPVASRWR